ncbi:MAG: hypothetical protein ACLPSW_30070, partial [Roseiarcus sp.]
MATESPRELAPTARLTKSAPTAPTSRARPGAESRQRRPRVQTDAKPAKHAHPRERDMGLSAHDWDIVLQAPLFKAMG